MIVFFCFLLANPQPLATDQFGQSHSPQSPGEGVTVIDFAASWCKPCWKALPRLEALHREHPELRILVCSEDEQVGGRDRLVKKLGLTMPVIWDQGHQWARRYQPDAMPTTMIVDSKGNILFRHGGSDAAGWDAFLKALSKHSNLN